MLLNGVNHVAVLTNDSDRLHRFYREVFDATVSRDTTERPGVRLSFVDIGTFTQLNVFQVEGNTEADRQTPMFGRGRIDHLGLQAASKAAFDTIRERLMAAGASDGFVTDFGPVLSVFFRDPDGLEGEVCVWRTRPPNSAYTTRRARRRPATDPYPVGPWARGYSRRVIVSSRHFDTPARDIPSAHRWPAFIADP